MVNTVKKELKKRHNIDFDKLKPFGPRKSDGVVEEMSVNMTNGRDINMDDYKILQLLHAKCWKMDDIIHDLYTHMEWRETNIPLPIMQN